MNVLDVAISMERTITQLPEPTQRQAECEELCEGVPSQGNEAVVVMLPKE